MVPMRAIFEWFGAGVEFDGASSQVTATKGGTTIVLTIGQNQAEVDGRTVHLETPPSVRVGRTYVPLRFVAEALGAEVRRDSQASTVLVRLGDQEGMLSLGNGETPGSGGSADANTWRGGPGRQTIGPFTVETTWLPSARYDGSLVLTIHHVVGGTEDTVVDFSHENTSGLWHEWDADSLTETVAEMLFGLGPFGFSPGSYRLEVESGGDWEFAVVGMQGEEANIKWYEHLSGTTLVHGSSDIELDAHGLRLHLGPISITRVYE